MGQDLRGRADPRRDVRPRPAKVSQATYWRRRVVVLAVGIGVLSGLAWGANGLLALRPTADQGTARSAATGPATPHASERPTHARSSPSPRPHPSPSRHRARPHALVAAGACAPSQVMLRVSSPQYWYPAGVTPRFTVHATSQAGKPCRFDMGTGSVSVVVTSVGRRVWSSADCASGGPDTVVLARGVPKVRHISWNGETSAPGCRGVPHPVRAGEYQVTAVAGHQSSPTVNVVLGAAGASGP